MAHTIKPEDIKVGDTIRITHKVKVGYVLKDGKGSNGSVRAESSAAYYTLSDAEIELVDRPLPPLPTTPGSVIRLSSSDGPATANWMLGVNDMWMSGLGAQQTEESLQRIIQLREWKFEVIA